MSAQSKAAEPMIKVSPVILDISLSPGKTYQYTIEVENLLPIPLPLRASLEDFESANEEGGFQLNNPTHISPLLSWIEIQDKDSIIPAQTKKEIQLTVTIPNTVPIGGYYGVMYLQPVVPSSDQFASFINAKVGVLLLANVGAGTPHNAEIVEFTTDEPFTEKGPSTFTIRAKNTSLSHIIAKPILTIKPLFGEEEKVTYEDKFIFPDKIRKWKKETMLKDYWHGLYTVKLDLSLGNGVQVSQTLYIVAFPIKKVLLAVFTVGLIIVVFRRRNRLGKAWSALTKFE